MEKHIGSDALSCDLQPDISLQDSLAGLAGESAGLWACDAYSGQMYLSVRARELLWIGASEHATLPRMAAATHPDDRAVLEHWLLGRDHAHSVFTIDIRLAGADAGDRKLRIDGRVHRDGISLRSGGSIVDVTERRREEERLRFRDSQLNAVADGVATLISYVDRDLRYRFANHAYERWFGIRPDEVVGRTVRELLGDAGFEHIEPHLRQALGGLTAKFTTAVPHNDGSSRHVSAAYTPDFAENGEVRGVFVAVTDISDLHRIERELRESRSLLQVVIDSSPTSIFMKNAEGRYLLANPETRRLLRGDERPIVGLTDMDLFPPEAARNLRENDLHVMASRRPEQCEESVVTPDGVLRTFITVKAPLIDEEGRVFGICGIATDITDRKNMLDTLRQSEEAAQARADELSAVLEAAPAAIWIAHDPECTVVTGNRVGGAMLRAPAQGNLSKSADAEGHLAHFRVLSGGRELSPGELPLQRAARGETIRDFEEEIVFDNGDRRHLLGDAVPLRDAHGQPRGAVAAFVDVTRLREAAEQLADANRRKDEFLAMLGHELRNPLSAIQGASNLLALTGEAQPQTARLYGILERQSSQLKRLVDDLLDVSRITHGKIEIRREDIPVRAVVDRAVEGSRQLIEASKHELVVAIEDESMRVRGDLARLSQVICNLLNNAARYTPEGGHIRLEAARRGDMLRIAVSDDGMGIAPEALERIFELFEQVDHMRVRSGGGLGVGLALARALVQLHGGTLTASSEGPGRGSVFEILLPLS